VSATDVTQLPCLEALLVACSLTQTMTPGKQPPAHLRELGKDDVGHLLVLIVVTGQPGQILGAVIFSVIAIPVLGIVVLIIPSLAVLRAHDMSAFNSLIYAAKSEAA